MIVKCLSRKSNTSQLLKYIFRYILNDQKLETASPFLIKHNIRSRSINGYIKEFEKVESLRINKRSNNVQVYHSILSFSNLDKEKINDEILMAIARKFISLRGKNTLFVGTKHSDKENIHLHLAHSSVTLAGRASRISRRQLHELKISLDSFQKSQFPTLVNSLPQHGLKQTLGLPAKAPQKSILSSREPIRNGLLQHLETAYKNSKSSTHFLETLKSLNYESYYRSGRLTGIKIGERKFRFSTLGYSPEKILTLDVEQQKIQKDSLALQELCDIRNRSKALDKEKDIADQRHGNRREIFNTLSPFSLELEGIGNTQIKGISLEHDLSPG